VKVRAITWLAIVGIFFLCTASRSGAGELTDEIRAAIDKGLAVLKNGAAHNGSAPDEAVRKEQIEQLREIVRPLFNFDEMARRSLGRHWAQRTPEEREEFVSVFTDYLEMTYAGKIDLYKGGDVVFLREVVDEDYARVDSKVTDSKGTGYEVSYKLLNRDGDWRIYDVIVENVSLVNNYRSQFSRIIRNFSFEELVKKMKQKSG